MSVPHGDQPSSPSRLHRHFKEVTDVPTHGPAGAVLKQTRRQERCAGGRLVCVDQMAEANPWRGLLNNSGDGEAS
jgi:hypothetical protein